MEKINWARYNDDELLEIMEKYLKTITNIINEIKDRDFDKIIYKNK